MTTPPRPRPVYVWDTFHATRDGVEFGASGATTVQRNAIRALGAALRTEPPGTTGVVMNVELHPAKTATYTYGGIIARAQHDPASGCVTWSKGALL